MAPAWLGKTTMPVRPRLSSLMVSGRGRRGGGTTSERRGVRECQSVLVSLNGKGESDRDARGEARRRCHTISIKHIVARTTITFPWSLPYRLCKSIGGRALVIAPSQAQTSARAPQPSSAGHCDHNDH